MTQELIYTSAPKGLKPGSRGFCTVASSSGMARPLVERLESLSGYRHIFAPGDARSALNPIAWSYLRLSIGGATYHVLARIGDAGLDYSGRTNKIAHHVVCSPQDLNAAGPAWTLAQPGWMASEWRGEPRILASERNLPASDAGPSPCSNWERLAGDAGWAGELAQTACDQRPALIIYPLGVDILPLLVEAQQLLPPSLRWQVSFSTYMMKLPPGIECQWQGHPAESCDLPTLRRTPNALILELTPSMGLAPDSPASLAAREGRTIPVPAHRSTPPLPRNILNGGISLDADRLPMPASDAAAQHPKPPRSIPPTLASTPNVPARQGVATRRPRAPWLVLAGILIALLGATATFLASRHFLAGQQLAKPQQSPGTQDGTPKAKPAPPKSPPINQARPADASQEATDTQQLTAGEAKPPVSPQASAPPSSQQPPPPEQPAQPNSSNAAPTPSDSADGNAPWRFIAESGGLFDLIPPQATESIEIAAGPETGKWSLRIVENSLGSEWSITPTPGDLGESELTVAKKHSLPAINAGIFRIANQRLLFLPTCSKASNENALRELDFAVIALHSDSGEVNHVPMWGRPAQYAAVRLDERIKTHSVTMPSLIFRRSRDNIVSYRAYMHIAGFRKGSFETDSRMTQGNTFEWWFTCSGKSKTTDDTPQRHSRDQDTSDVAIRLTFLKSENNSEQPFFRVEVHNLNNNPDTNAISELERWGELEFLTKTEAATRDKEQQDGPDSIKTEQNKILNHYSDQPVFRELTQALDTDATNEPAIFFHALIAMEIGEQQFPVLCIGDPSPVLPDTLKGQQ